VISEVRAKKTAEPKRLPVDKTEKQKLMLYLVKQQAMIS